MSIDNLPSGWTVASIQALISQDGVFVDGDWVESKDQDPNGEVRLIQLADIGDGLFRNKSARFLKRAKAAKLRCTFLRKGDLLIARMPDPLGRACVFPLDGSERFVTVVDVCIIRTSVEVASPEFLRFAINFLGTRKQIYDLQTGSTRKRISRTNLATVTIPFPPRNEQKRIVAKIEELFSELDAGEESLRKARRQLGVYRQSLLKQAFEGKLTAAWREHNPDLFESPEQHLARIQAERETCYEERLKVWRLTIENGKGSDDEETRLAKPRKPEVPTRLAKDELSQLTILPTGWCWMTLESLSSPEPRSIQSGPFGSSLKHSEFTEKGILVIGIDNVREGYFSLGSQNRISPKKYKKLSKYTAKEKDFLITIMATVGRCCRVPDGLETAIITKHVYRVSPNVGLVNADYIVNAALGCPAIVQQINKDKFGQTRPGLNGSFIKALPVPLCSLPEQQEIVRLLDEQFTVIEQNEREIDTELKRSETLRQSILKKAFSGQLVAQDPADEPAAVLLERIRAEREAPKESHRKLTRSPKAKPAQEIEEKTVPSITPVQTRKPKPASTPGKTDLQVGLVALAIAAHENGSEHLDHVKVGKIVHLCDVIARLQLDRHPLKDAAGPNDFLQVKKVEHRAKMQGWFTVKKEPGAKAYSYQRGRNFDRLVNATEARLGSRLQTLRDLIGDLASMSVREVELVATVHAAWNNLILGGESQPTEEAIVKEARENWHPDKRRIPRERFFEAIAWIEEAEVIPSGSGHLIQKKK